MPVCYIFNHKGEKLLRFNATTNKYGSHITIGKSSKCDVCIDHITDASMNNQQLALSSSGRFWYVKDEKDSGKVYKNGKKIKNSVLKPGDFFRFGKLYFGYGEGSGPSNYDLVWETKCKHQKCRVVLWPGCNTIGLAPDNDIIMSNGRDVLNYHAILNVSGDKIFIQRVSKQAEIIVGKEIISKPVLISPDSYIVLGGIAIKIQRVKHNDTEPEEDLCKTHVIKLKENPGIVKMAHSYGLERKTKIVVLVLTIIILGIFGFLGFIMHFMLH